MMTSTGWANRYKEMTFRDVPLGFARAIQGVPSGVTVRPLLHEHCSPATHAPLSCSKLALNSRSATVKAMNPAKYMTEPFLFRTRLDRLNSVLAFPVYLIRNRARSGSSSPAGRSTRPSHVPIASMRGVLTYRQQARPRLGVMPLGVLA